MPSSDFSREIKSSGHTCGFTSKLQTWKVFRQNFLMMTRLAEYSENIGLSFENMRNKGLFGNNTFENCTFNFNSKNQFGLTERISNIKCVYLQANFFKRGTYVCSLFSLICSVKSECFLCVKFYILFKRQWMKSDCFVCYNAWYIIDCL